MQFTILHDGFTLGQKVYWSGDVVDEVELLDSPLTRRKQIEKYGMQFYEPLGEEPIIRVKKKKKIKR